MKLLQVEDDPAVGADLRRDLEFDDHDVQWVRDGQSAETMLQQGGFDAIILDLMLPLRSGMDILRSLRARGDGTPVLILSGRDSVHDRVMGLDAGADDYLTKPYEPDELRARLRALLRRHQGFRPQLLRHMMLTVDRAAHQTDLSGNPVHLSRHEFSLLCLLLEQRGRVLPRGELESALYGWNVDVESNTIEVHIHALRRKLGTELIRTVRGVGYTVDEPMQ
jgi:two-component system response regulator QseB